MWRKEGAERIMGGVENAMAFSHAGTQERGSPTGRAARQQERRSACAFGKMTATQLLDKRTKGYGWRRTVMADGRLDRTIT